MEEPGADAAGATTAQARIATAGRLLRHAGSSDPFGHQNGQSIFAHSIFCQGAREDTAGHADTAGHEAHDKDSNGPRHGRLALMQKMHNMGKQIEHLTTLFHEFECHFESNWPPPSHHEPIFLDDGVVDVDEAGAKFQSHEALLSAIQDDAVQDVQVQLQKSADPNLAWTDVMLNGKEFVSVAPLAAAVLQGNAAIVDMLVGYKASLESKYSFEAGAEKMLWTGNVIDACIKKNSLDMLMYLVQNRADIHALSSNGANLVWQAAYFGHASILEYLINFGVSVECRATSQDNSDVTYSPLHQAAISGHESTLSLLLEAQADVRHDDGHGRQPLDDAVGLGHPGIVKQLIINDADLLGVRPTDIFVATRRKGAKEPKSCLAHIFESQNPVLISMLAQSLTPKLLDLLTADDFLHFLSEPGDAPIHALKAIFQPYQLGYWEEQGGSLFRRRPRSGYIELGKRCNLMEGPHYRAIMKLFTSRRVIDPVTLQFIHRLLPVEPHRKGSMFVPATVYMCHIPYVHKDIRVLRALADCPSNQIFSTDACCAIINCKWAREYVMARFRMVIAGIEVANFMAINFITAMANESEYWGAKPLFFTNMVSLIIWSVAMFLEVLQILGYVSHGLAIRYIKGGRHWFDFVVLLVTGAVSIALLRLSNEARQDTWFCIALGLLVYCKWLRFLVYLRQIKTIGIHILPITQAMFDIFPFLLVLSIYLLAAINMFYALNTGWSFGDCFLLIWRLVVLGDVDAFELENRDELQLTVDLTTGDVAESRAAQTGNFLVVRILMVVASFLMTVSLMNLFLAMLCVSYSEAYEVAHLEFMRSRARIVLDQHAVRAGTARFLCCFCKKEPMEYLIYGSSGSDYDCSPDDPRRSVTISRSLTQTMSSTLSRLSRKSSISTPKTSTSATIILDSAHSSQKQAFLWFAKQTEFESDEDSHK